MWWLLNPGFYGLINMRSMTELLFVLLSANLVGPGLTGDDKSRSRVLAMVSRSSAWME